VSRVLVTQTLPEGTLAPLDGHQLIQAGEGGCLSSEELLDAVVGVDAIVCVLTDRISAPVIKAAKNLRVIGNVAVGLDNIDLAAAAEAGVEVINTPGVLDDATADLSFALILATRRCMRDAERDLRAGRWSGWGLQDHLGYDVTAATLGLVGYGRIAKAVERRAQGFAMTVRHWSRTDSGLPGRVQSLDQLLSISDVVSIHVPLTDATRGLIGRRELKLMQPTSVLINTARGGIVDEQALADALHAGEILGAGLDVYVNEPDLNPNLLSAPRIVLLPHIGSATLATRSRMALMATSGVAAALARTS
jgi:glyoxylate reductase